MRRITRQRKMALLSYIWKLCFAIVLASMGSCSTVEEETKCMKVVDNIYSLISKRGLDQIFDLFSKESSNDNERRLLWKNEMEKFIDKSGPYISHKLVKSRSSKEWGKDLIVVLVCQTKYSKLSTIETFAFVVGTGEHTIELTEYRIEIQNGF